jgi:hypothetical protein
MKLERSFWEDSENTIRHWRLTSTGFRTLPRQKSKLAVVCRRTKSDHLDYFRYCKRIYIPGTDTAGIYLTLLRIYLQPTTQVSVDLLEPALSLISRHGPRLDAVETLQLLPPLVTTEDIKAFLVDALRVPLFDTTVVRSISKSRDDQLARRLMSLQSRVVKVTDSRMYVLIYLWTFSSFPVYLHCPFTVARSATNAWGTVLLLFMRLGMNYILLKNSQMTYVSFTEERSLIISVERCLPDACVHRRRYSRWCSCTYTLLVILNAHISLSRIYRISLDHDR